MSAHAPEARRAILPRMGGSANAAFLWTSAAFAVSLLLAIFILLRFGDAVHGTVQALRATARWCFLLFWPAYAGGAAAKLLGPGLFGIFDALARRGREFGLAFAAALSVHLALVLWFLHVAKQPLVGMIIFWIGALCAYLLALFSLPRLRAALGLRAWRALCTGTLEYIALVFAVDFIVAPLHAGGLLHYPPSYLPFVAMLLGGAVLRAAVRLQQRRLWPT